MATGREFDAFGIPYDRRVSRFEEALAALTAHADEQAKKDEFSGVVLVAGFCVLFVINWLQRWNKRRSG